jgi:DNA-binding HxlR family transcriptional regulator
VLYADEMTVLLEGRLAREDRVELGDACPIDRTSALLARRSTILLLREASYGTSKYDDFVRRTGLTESVTAAQLRNLTDEGLLQKRAYREPPQRQRFEYILTAAGHDLVPILLALATWGDRHRPLPHELRMVHAGCGADIEVDVRCADGHHVGEGEVVVGLEPRRHDPAIQ